MAKRGRKNTSLAVEQRWDKVTRLYNDGLSFKQIAQECGVSSRMVYYDLINARKHYRSSTLLNMHEAQIKELAILDMIESEAWEAWELSKQPLKRITKRKTKEGTDGQEMILEWTEIEQERIPHDGYLEKALNAVRMRCNLMGLLNPDNPGYIPPPMAPDALAPSITNNTLIINAGPQQVEQRPEIETYSAEELDAIDRLSKIINKGYLTEQNLN